MINFSVLNGVEDGRQIDINIISVGSKKGWGLFIFVFTQLKCFYWNVLIEFVY